MRIKQTEQGKEERMERRKGKERKRDEGRETKELRGESKREGKRSFLILLSLVCPAAPSPPLFNYLCAHSMRSPQGREGNSGPLLLLHTLFRLKNFPKMGKHCGRGDGMSVEMRGRGGVEDGWG